MFTAKIVLSASPRWLLAKKREQPFQLLGIGTLAVFTDLKGFGVADRAGFVQAVKVRQFALKPFGLTGIALLEAGTDLAMAFRLFGGVGRHEFGRAVGAAFVKLRFERVQGIEFLVDHAVDR